MLEDPSYSEIVRWGDEGDSFVVLEVIHALVSLGMPGRSFAANLYILGHSARNLPKPSFRNISNIATSPVLYDN
jgi:hypothetical protein